MPRQSQQSVNSHWMVSPNSLAYQQQHPLPSRHKVMFTGLSQIMPFSPKSAQTAFHSSPSLGWGCALWHKPHLEELVYLHRVEEDFLKQLIWLFLSPRCCVRGDWWHQLTPSHSAPNTPMALHSPTKHLQGSRTPLLFIFVSHYVAASTSS